LSFEKLFDGFYYYIRVRNPLKNRRESDGKNIEIDERELKSKKTPERSPGGNGTV
jgi:hypothetical protein